MKKRILVLGASGFIGSRVVAALEASTWAHPLAASHRSPLEMNGVSTVNLDAADEMALMHLVSEIDGVVNCIGGSASTMVDTSRKLYAAAARARHRPRVVHLSSMAVYGAAVGVVNETAQLDGGVGAYASAKIECEKLAAAYENMVVLRPGCVYGPGSAQWSERVARWLRSQRVGDLGAAGDGFCNLVYVDDVVAAILAALSLPRIEGQAFNLGSPAPPTWNEYFLSFARLLGAVPVRRITRRRLVLETEFWAPPLKIAELATRLARLRQLEIPAPIPPSLLRLWRQDIKLDVQKAQRVFGLTWTPLENGLRETAVQRRMTTPA